jgi:hypothetical protein
MCTLTSFPPAQGMPAYVLWEARLRELTEYVQRRTATTHSRSRFLSQGTGATSVHLGGVAAATARRGKVEPAAASYAQPADAHQPAAVAPAPAARALPQAILVGSSSSRHHRELRHNIEAQRQEDARAARHHAHPGADPTWRSYSFDGGCLAFTDALRCVLWPRKFRPGITFKYDGSTDPHEFLQVYITAMEIMEGANPTWWQTGSRWSLRHRAVTRCFAFLGAPCARGKTCASNLLMCSKAGTSTREPLTTCWRYLSVPERHCTTSCSAFVSLPTVW